MTKTEEIKLLKRQIRELKKQIVLLEKALGGDFHDGKALTVQVKPYYPPSRLGGPG